MNLVLGYGFFLQVVTGIRGVDVSNYTSNPGIVDFLRDAVWGEGNPVSAHGVSVSRTGPNSASQEPSRQEATMVRHAEAIEANSQIIPSSVRQRIEALELTERDGRTSQGTQEYCSIGACCGWGHRLMRQAKTFTSVHFVQNRTAILEWGPCPNRQGQAGRGKTRQPDFSSLMLEDSVDIVNFQDTSCGRNKNADCSKCGSGNDISTAKWNDVTKHFPAQRSILQSVGTGRTEQIAVGSFFHPFQYFVRSLLTQLKPEIKQRVASFIAENFQGRPVIGVHHRHGNGELDDFVDKKTGRPGSRLNRNNTQVIEWMMESVSELAAEYNLTDYRVFFATDSPEIARMYRAHDQRVFVFDAEAKEEIEGKGFIMPGWQGWGRSHGMDPEEKSERCAPETIRAFLDMALLGYVDMLVMSKRSSFTFFPSVMMGFRAKPVCLFTNGPRSTSFSCRSSASDMKHGLVPRSKVATGLAPSSRKNKRRAL